MRKISKAFLIASSFSFLIFGIIFQILGKKTNFFPLGGSTSLKSANWRTEVEPLQKNSKELSCFQDKNGDGEVELSLLQQTKEEKEFDCLLLGCNLFEFE